MENTLSGADPLVSEFLFPFDALVHASSDEDATTSLQKAVKNLGFDQVMFAVIPQPALGMDDVYMRSTYPQAWRKYYDQHNLQAADPTVEYCFKSSAPLIWMPQIFKAAAQQALNEEAPSFGLRVGVTLPVHSPAGEVGMLTCVRDQATRCRIHARLAA